MLNNKAVFFTPVVLLLVATPALAGVATNVPLQDALSGRVRVSVAAEGGGTILDFSQIGEKIEKITLDDPSKVMTDHCLITKSCNGHPEPIVRLFRVNIAQKDIPSTKTTQLTVMTTDPSGQWNSYIFAVTPTAKPSVYTKFVIGGRAQRNTSLDFASAALGARQAQEKRLLVDPALKGRVNTFLRLTQGGMSEKVAAKKAGISMPLVARLESLGQDRLAQGGGTLPVASLSPIATIYPPPPFQKSKHHHKKKEIENVPPQPQTISSRLSTPEFQAAGTTPIVAQASVQPQPKAVATAKAQVPAEVKPDAAFTGVVYSKPNIPFYGAAKSEIALPNDSSGSDTTPPSQPLSLKPKSMRVKTNAKTVPEFQPQSQSDQKPTRAVHANQIGTLVQPNKTVSNQDYANALLRGLNKARIDGKIRYGSNKWYSVNGAIRLLRRGFSLDKAIAASGMQRDGFMRLLSDGGMEV